MPLTFSLSSFRFQLYRLCIDIYVAIIGFLYRLIGKKTVLFSLTAENILKEVEIRTKRSVPLRTSKEWMSLLEAATECLNETTFMRASSRFLLCRKYLIQLVMETVYANDVIRRNPGALLIAINRPVFIVGPGCCGSNLLQALLCAYPDVHYVTSEKLHSVTLGLTDKDHQVGSRWPDPLSIPMANKPLSQEPCECADLVGKYIFLQVFGLHCCDYQYAFKRYPACKDFVNYAYELYKEDLKLMFYLSREFQPAESSANARFVFMSSDHTAFLDAIANAFPDATIIQLHREPAHVTEMLLNQRKSTTGKPKPQMAAKNLLDQLDFAYKQMIQQSRNQQGQSGRAGKKPGVIDVQYDDLVGDPVGVCAQIVESLGWEGDSETGVKLQIIADKMKAQEGQVNGKGLSQYGLTAEDVRGRFKVYCDYYNL
jgi:hypothetical protein